MSDETSPALGKLAAIIDSAAPQDPAFRFRDAERIARFVIAAGWSAPTLYAVQYPDGSVGTFAVGAPVPFNKWREALANGSLGHPPGTKLVQRDGEDCQWEDIDPAVFTSPAVSGLPDNRHHLLTIYRDVTPLGPGKSYRGRCACQWGSSVRTDPADVSSDWSTHIYDVESVYEESS